MNSKTKTFLISAILTIVLVYYLFSHVSIKEISKTISSSNINYLILSFAIYLAIYFLRSVRFKELLEDHLSLKKLFPIVCIHNFMNMALPLKTGELSYSYLLKKSSDIRYQRSISNLLVARVMDLGGIITLFLFSLSIYLSDIRYKILSLSASIFSLSLLFLFFIFIKKINFLNKLRFRNGIFVKIKNFISEIVIESSKYNLSRKVKIVLISLTINSLMFIFGYLLMKSFGVGLSIWAIFVGGTLAFFITIIPIQGLFNFGTLEAAWTVSYMLVGLSKEQAIITGFSYHIINILFTIVMFLIGIINNYLKKFNSS